jgi:hypothetical protein
VGERAAASVRVTGERVSCPRARRRRPRAFVHYQAAPRTTHARRAQDDDDDDDDCGRGGGWARKITGGGGSDSGRVERGIRGCVVFVGSNGRGGKWGCIVQRRQQQRRSRRG